MKLNHKLTALLLCSVLLSTAAVSCGDEKKVLESTKEEKSVVMVVDGYDVPLELYRYVALNTKSDMEAVHGASAWVGEGSEELVRELEERIDETIIHMYTTMVVCEDYGIKPSDSYFDDTVDLKMKSVYESYDNDYEAYNNEIAGYYMTDNVYRFITKNEIFAEELINKMASDGTIPSSPEKLEEILTGDEFVHVKQLLVPADNGKSDEENYAYAEELLEKVEAGEDFDALIQKYGGDLYLFNNSDGYYVSRGSYFEEFEEAAFSLEVGEHSGIIKTSAGYSILKRYEKDPVYMAENFDTLSQDYIRGQFNLILAEREKKLTVKKTAALDKYSIFSMSMDD